MKIIAFLVLLVSVGLLLSSIYHLIHGTLLSAILYMAGSGIMWMIAKLFVVADIFFKQRRGV